MIHNGTLDENGKRQASQYNYHKGREYTADDIGQDLKDQYRYYICPPKLFL